MYPTKVLSCVLTSLTESEYLSENDNTWVSHNKAYRWEAVITVNAQPHSWAGSTTPYFYNGLDVFPGDFIITKGQARLLKIIQVTSSTDQTINCIVEDDEKLNLYTDPFQNADGTVTLGAGFIFSVVNGMPAIFPLPEATPDFNDEYVGQILSRFAYQEKNKTLIINQSNHNLSVNDLITLSASGQYSQASYTTDSYDAVVGIVTEVIASGVFKYQPVGQFISVNLPGNAGDIQYLDPNNPGKIASTVDDIFPFSPALIKIDNDTAVFATLNFNTSTAKLQITSDLIPWADTKTIMLTAQTTDSTATLLLQDGANVILENNSFYSFNLDVVAADNTGVNGTHLQLQGTIRLNNNVISLIGTPANVVFHNMLTNSQINAAVSQPNIIQFFVVGLPSTNIRWNSRLNLTKVTAL